MKPLGSASHLTPGDTLASSQACMSHPCDSYLPSISCLRGMCSACFRVSSPADGPAGRPVSKRFVLHLTVGVLAGAPTSVACSLCQAGTYWTGSGWQPFKLWRRGQERACRVSSLTGSSWLQQPSLELRRPPCAETPWLQERLPQAPAAPARRGHTRLAQV